MPKVPCLRLELYGCTAPASCPDPGIPYQGNRIDHDFHHGSTVTFTCPRDYVMEGAAAIKCTDGQWNSTKPSCKAPCVEPTDPRHGLKMDRDFRHGRSVRFYCFSGYQRVGAAFITCNDSKWDGWVPLCKGVCGRPRTSSRVQLQGSRYLHGDEVTFSCPRNYDLFGKAKLRCVDRKWDSPIPECKARCTLVAGPPEHGFYVKGFISYKDDMIKHGERISYGCNATYALVGDSTQECNDGRWTNPRPSCKACKNIMSDTQCQEWSNNRRCSISFVLQFCKKTCRKCYAYGGGS